MGVDAVEPGGIVRPESTGELVRVIEEAVRSARPVLAIGRGRARSDVARAQDGGVAIALDRLPLETPPWRVRADLATAEPRVARGLGIVRVRAAATVREVLEQLEREGRTLASVPIDLEGTIAGTIATAAHGAGMTAGSLADSVAAIEMVTAYRGGVRPLRVEPRNGIGTPRPDLVQDDDLFRTAVVSMGCTGAMTAITLVTIPSLALEERRELTAWSALRDGLVRRARSEDFLELAMLPLGTADGTCLVRSRARTDARELEIGADRGTGPALLEAAGRRRIRGPSWQVLSAPLAERAGATASIEVLVPIERGPEAIDATLASLRGRPAAIGIRFTRASSAYLAMQHGRESCAIEVEVDADAEPGWAPLLTAVERALIDPRLEGRPHWGMRHTIAGGFLDHYPKAARWRAAQRVLGGAAFASAFSRRMGIRA